MGLTLTTSAAPGKIVRVPVPAEVASDLAGLWAEIQLTGEDGHAILDTQAERNQFEMQLRTWAEDNNLKVRKVRGKDIPANEFKFRLATPEAAAAEDAAQAATGGVSAAAAG